MLAVLFAVVCAHASDPLVDRILKPSIEEPPPAAVEPVAPPDNGEVAVLIIDSRLPCEVLVDGVKLGQFYFATEARFHVTAVPHTVRVYVAGNPVDVNAEFAADEVTRVFVGKTGVTTASEPLTEQVEASETPVEFMVKGSVGAQIRFDDQRVVLSAGKRQVVALVPGAYQVSVRSHDGTVIWANGELTIGGAQKVFVQLSEGRMPEVSGQGNFRSGG